MDLSDVMSMIADRATEWAGSAIKMVPNILVAVFLLVLFWILSILVRRLVERMVARFYVYRSVARLTARLVRLAVVIVGIILAFYALHLNKVVASALAGIGLFSVVIGLAAKNTGKDYLAGFIINFTHPYRKEHLVELGKFMGYVESIDLRATTIRTQQGQRIIIPSDKIVENEIINYYSSGERRVDIKCGIAQDADLDKAEDVAIKAVKSLKTRNSDRDVELFYEEIGEYTINFTLRFWTDPDQKTYLKARSEAIKAIQQSFMDNGITMPNPIRTLEFSTVKEKSLREQLQEAMPDKKEGKKQKEKEKKEEKEERNEKDEKKEEKKK